MFKENDILKTTMQLHTSEGMISTIKLPLEEEIQLPDNIVYVQLMEYHGEKVGGYTSYNIYIGKQTTIIEELEKDQRINLNKLNENINSVNETKLVKKGDRIIAILKQGDRVVPNKERLEEVITGISEQIKIINTSVNKIRTIGK